MVRHSVSQKQFLVVFFLFLHKRICCAYSLEAPQRGSSDWYPHVFSWRNINFYWLKKSARAKRSLWSTLVKIDP